MLCAGPCGITSRDQALEIAEFVKAEGATHFRGGVWKGQNRPFVNGVPEYLGMGEEGLPILKEIQDKLNLPVVCDAQSIEQVLQLNAFDIEYLMIGARNMDNLCLLREVRKIYDDCKPGKKIILKRGPSSTIDEFIGAAEHLGGPERVILCERGIVSYDRTPQTRWRLDMVGVAYLKTYTDYKVIVDPSHGSGDRNLVSLLSKCALAISDGLMVEVHFAPDTSPTDAKQTIDFREFQTISWLYKNKDMFYGQRELGN